jgi:hypothetical protein
VSPTVKKFLDIAERAGFTYVESFLGFLLASQIWTAVDKVGVAKGAAAAALPAALAIVKGSLASLWGNTASASALPATADPATPSAQ